MTHDASIELVLWLVAAWLCIHGAILGVLITRQRRLTRDLVQFQLIIIKMLEDTTRTLMDFTRHSPGE